MTTVQISELEESVAELYMKTCNEEAEPRHITNLANYIENICESGMENMRNGNVMSVEEFKDKINNIKLV